MGPWPGEGLGRVISRPVSGSRSRVLVGVGAFGFRLCMNEFLRLPIIWAFEGMVEPYLCGSNHPIRFLDFLSITLNRQAEKFTFLCSGSLITWNSGCRISQEANISDWCRVNDLSRWWGLSVFVDGLSSDSSVDGWGVRVPPSGDTRGVARGRCPPSFGGCPVVRDLQSWSTSPWLKSRVATCIVRLTVPIR